MKKIYIVALICLATGATAQPVIENASQRPGESFKAGVSYGTIGSGPGDAGADKTWNFSGLIVHSKKEFIVLSTTNNQYMNDYPTADYVYIVDSAYTYLDISATKMEMITNNLTAPSGAGDYAINPRTLMEFPFSYGMTVLDYWQSYVSPAVDSVRLKYDAFGTLKMPNGVYTNVVRISENYLGGTNYVWYTVNPLAPVLTYDYISGVFTQIVLNPTAVNNIPENEKLIAVYPNPSTGNTTFRVNMPGPNPTTLKMYDVAGRLVHTELINAPEAIVDLRQLTAGVYQYKITQGKKTVSGKWVKQ